MEINFKEFRKKLIDDEKTIKQWCIENNFDRDRLRNIQNGLVKPTDEEIKVVKAYYGVNKNR